LVGGWGNVLFNRLAHVEMSAGEEAVLPTSANDSFIEEGGGERVAPPPWIFYSTAAILMSILAAAVPSNLATVFLIWKDQSVRTTPFHAFKVLFPPATHAVQRSYPLPGLLGVGLSRRWPDRQRLVGVDWSRQVAFWASSLLLQRLLDCCGW